jgi:hypothetical protein
MFTAKKVTQAVSNSKKMAVKILQACHIHSTRKEPSLDEFIASCLVSES